MRIFKITKNLSWVLTLMLPGVMICQTTNIGDLVVSPGTIFSTVSDFKNLNTGSFINDGEAYIYAHFINDGLVDYSTGAEGYTRFQGDAVQQISGINRSYFYDVLFQNESSQTGSFELNSEIEIDNIADFNLGIVKNNGFGGLVIFADNAGYTGLSNESHVNGQVQKLGDDSFEFPIGDQQWFRFAAISAPNVNNAAFTAEYLYEDPSGAGLRPFENRADIIEIINTDEYWSITNDFGPTDVLITLSWSANSTPEEIISSPPEQIKIVRWDESSQLWVDEGGIIDVLNQTITTALSLQKYGVFTLARVKDNVTPPSNNVLIYNGVTPNGDGINDYFRIENIQQMPNNNVEIYNRWGVKVFSADNYDTNGNVFSGASDARITIGENKLLPTGTYYYVLSYDHTDGGTARRIKKAGYLYLTTE